MLSKQLFAYRPFKYQRLLIVISFIFSFTREINTHFLPSFLYAEFFTRDFLDYVEIIENFASIVIGTVLLQCLNITNLKKILICSLICFLIGILNIYILETYHFIKINLLILATSSFVIIASIILNLLRYEFPILNIAYFFVFYFLGYILAYIMHVFLPNQNININIVIVLSCLLLILGFFVENHDHQKIYNSFYEVSFGQLIRATEPLLINGIIIGYIFANTYWHYDIWAEINKLEIYDIQTVWFYMAIASILATPLLLHFIKSNTHLLILFLILLLLISYSSFLHFKYDLLFGAISASLLGISLYGILLCSLYLMINRFSNGILKSAVILFYTIIYLGIFFGIIAAEKIINNGIKEILPSYSIILIYLSYYIHLIFYNRLYKHG